MPRREPNRTARRVELKKTGGVITGGGTVPAGAIVPGFVSVSSWTSSGSLYYYDLEHARNREQVFIVMYDTVTNKYVENIADREPVTGSETSKLRIWLAWDPGADRIQIMYL